MDTYGFSDQELIDILPKLTPHAMRMTRDKEKARDLVSSTVVRMLTYKHTFQSDTKLIAWAITIMKSCVYDEWRKRKHEVSATIETIDSFTGSYDIFDQLEAREALRRVAKVKLPHQQRDALFCVVMTGMTYPEAAEYMGLKEGTVKSQVNRARNALKEACV